MTRISFPNTTEEPPSDGAAASKPRVWSLTIAAHPRMHRIGEQCRLDELGVGRVVALSRLVPDFRTTDGRVAGPLDEPHVSRTPLRIALGQDGAVIFEPPDKPGARVTVNGIPLRSPIECREEVVSDGVLIDLAGRVLLLLHETVASVASVPKYGLIGESCALNRVRAEIRRAATIGLPVLVRGESGTGKELVARALHAASPRAARAYVALNIGALNPQTAVAELFGHVRGSFTGAVREHEGLFANADGGTLFLDEIGEASAEVQVMLLRVLESGEVQPLGGRPGRRVDVRVIAATDVDLERAVLDGRFRIALLHRLAGYELRLPPLRERRDDIPRLLLHFIDEELRRRGEPVRLHELAADTSTWLPVRLMAALIRHDWPGNVRELGNVARRIVGALQSGACPTGVIAYLGDDGTRADVPTPAAVAPTTIAPDGLGAPGCVPSEEEVLVVMAQNGWQISATARALGISRKTLYGIIAQSERMQRARDLGAKVLRKAIAESDGDIARAAASLRVSIRALRLRLRELKISP